MIISDLDFMEKVTVENLRVNGGGWELLAASFSGAVARQGGNIGRSRSRGLVFGPRDGNSLALAGTSASAFAGNHKSYASSSSGALYIPGSVPLSD